MTYKAVFFDWGGVIATDPGEGFLTDVLRSIGADETQVAEIYNGLMRQFMRGELTEAEFWQLLRAEYDLTIDDSISDEFKKWNGLVANDDILQLAREVKARGYTVAILSNILKPAYDMIKQAGYYDPFDVVIASCEVGLSKPAVEIYELALERAGVTAEQSIFIDDKEKCLAPAREMGFATVLAQSPEQIIADVNALLA